jgi:hypothetical protein
MLLPADGESLYINRRSSPLHGEAVHVGSLRGLAIVPGIKHCYPVPIDRSNLMYPV